MRTADDNVLFERLQQLRDDAREAFNAGARSIPLSQPLDPDTALAGLLADRLSDVVTEAYEAFVRKTLEHRRAA